MPQQMRKNCSSRGNEVDPLEQPSIFEELQPRYLGCCNQIQFLFFSSASLKAVAFFAVVFFDVAGEIAKGHLDALDEVFATRSGSAQGHDRLPFGKVVGHGHHLTVFGKTMDSALDELISGLSTA